MLKDAGLIQNDLKKQQQEDSLLPKVTRTDVDIMFTSVLAQESQLNAKAQRPKSASSKYKN